MKKLIFVISICAFFSFSLVFSNYYTSDRNYSTSEFLKDLFSSGNKILNYSTPSDSAESENDSTENQVVNGVTDIANMLNERGFYKSNGFSFDEQEIINDFNGNLIFNIPLYNYPLAGHLNYSVSMKYNGSVGHQFFPGDLNTYRNYPQRYNMNIPEWIVDFNGIAVQVLNFETNFFTTENGSNNIISDDSVRLLIPGYHYSNSLEAASENKLDKINILAGDGSVISLVRVATNDTNPDSLYIGNYVYEGKEMYYKAKVTYLETSGSAGDKSRKIELMKGDGTVMEFIEYKRNYSDFPTNAIVNARTKPRVLLLETIRDGFGHEINLEYSFGLQQFGRPLLSKIEAIGYSQKDIYVNMEYSIIEGLYSNMSGLHFIHSSKVNGNYNMIYESLVAHYPVGQNSVTNHRARIKSIKNILNKKINIKYENYIRSFTNMDYYSTGGFTYSISNLKRINNFKSFLGKTTQYVYSGPNSISVSESGSDRLKSVEFEGYGRDKFYTNMLESKSDTNNNIPVSVTGFTYVYTNNSGIVGDVDSNDVYRTDKSITNSDNSTLNETPAYVKTVRKYNVYPLHNSNNFYQEQPDLQGITKLMSDSTFTDSLSMQVNKYYYHLGEYLTSGSAGYNGSFLILNKINSYNGINKLWKYEYIYVNNNFDLPVKSQKETDPLNNSTQTLFKNLYFENYFYKKATNILSDVSYGYMNLFMINLDSLIIRKDYQNNVTALASKEYFEDTNSVSGYLGQIKNEKIISTSDTGNFIKTEYEYYKNDTTGKFIYGIEFYPNKNGNIKLVKKPNNQIEKYFYHLISTSEMWPDDVDNINQSQQFLRHKFKVKYNNGSIKDTNETIWDTRFPIRIDNYYINGSQTDTLSINYKSYNISGNPEITYGRDLYITKFVYQPIDRINSVTLPGDFSTVPDSMSYSIDTNYISTSLEIASNGWGYFDFNKSDSNAVYTTAEDYSSLKICNLFKMDIEYPKMHFAFIKLNVNSDFYNITSLDSAIFTINPLTFSASYDGQPISQTLFETYINGISVLNLKHGEICNNPASLYKSYGQFNHDNNLIPLDTFSNNCSSGSCCYKPLRFDVKNLISNFIDNNIILNGLALRSVYIGPEGSLPNSDIFQMNISNCNGNNSWFQYYKPMLYLYGKLDLSDTLKILIIKGGTIKYQYDDLNQKIDVFSVRNTLDNDRSRITYSVDGFGNVIQKDIYTGSSSIDSFNYNLNYLNIASKSTDALNNSTLFSYDGLGRIIKTKFSDTSSVRNFYAYYDHLNVYFDTAYSGFIEKQTYRDEEGNDFEKYFDAVGNLRRERKFIDGSTTGDDPPGFLTTDYLYDSLYRLTGVKTPAGKIIRYSYDSYGRQSKRITPDAGQTDYSYDKNSNLTFSQDAVQRSTNADKFTFRNYDGLNRLTGIGENIFLDDSPSNGDQFISTNPDYYLTINVYDTISSAIVNSLFTAPPDYTSPVYSYGNLVSTAYRTRYSDSWNFKYYKYDIRGRVIKMWNIVSGFDTLITDYTYNSQDHVTDYSHLGNNVKISFRNTYDYAGRLESVEYYAGWPDDPYPNYVKLAEYLYNENSQLYQQLLNDGAIKNNYFYNNRNWIYSMQNSNGIFEYTNEYFLNGNVKSQEFSGSYNDNFTYTSDLNFNCKYDLSNRLIETENNNQQYKDHYKLENKYDKDGNITELKRYNGSGSLMDNFNYAYYSNTNKLQRVFGSGTQYTYDANGNMIIDEINRNKDIRYDYRNLIIQLRHKKIIFEDSMVYVTYYNYDEAGMRIRKKVYQYIGTQNPDSSETPDIADIGDAPTVWELINDEVYSRDISGRELAIYVNGNIKQTNIWGIGNEGYISSSEYPNFYLKDHLGSIRIVTNENDEVISAQDYDTWGYLLENREYESEESVHKFTGKERDEKSGYDYFGARYYDARVGRWGTIDPILEEYLSFSPYSYSLINPLLFKDPNGKWIVRYDEAENRIYAIAEENDLLYDLYDQLGLNEREFSEKYEISDLNKYEIISGETNFDITSFVLKNTNFSYDPRQMNCFSSSLTGIGLFDEEVMIKNTQDGKGFTQDLISNFGLVEVNSLYPGVMKTWVNHINVTYHSAIFILRNQEGIEYYFGRPGPDSKISIQTSDRLNQLYPDFQNYLLNYP